MSFAADNVEKEIDVNEIELEMKSNLEGDLLDYCGHTALTHDACDFFTYMQIYCNTDYQNDNDESLADELCQN